MKLLGTTKLPLLEGTTDLPGFYGFNGLGLRLQLWLWLRLRFYGYGYMAWLRFYGYGFTVLRFYGFTVIRYMVTDIRLRLYGYGVIRLRLYGFGYTVMVPYHGTIMRYQYFMFTIFYTTIVNSFNEQSKPFCGRHLLLHWFHLCFHLPLLLYLLSIEM